MTDAMFGLARHLSRSFAGLAAFTAGQPAYAADLAAGLGTGLTEAGPGVLTPVIAALIAGLGFLLLQGLWRRGR